jgi:HSP20 family protein
MLPPARSIGGELERMRQEMDRIWDRFSKELSSSTLKQDWNPSLNLAETKDSLVAELEVPGISPEDIDVSVTGETLTVTGEKKQEETREEKSYHLLERVYGKFSRSIQLPTTVDPDRVEARYQDGILLISMAKTETVRSRRIEVKTT